MAKIAWGIELGTSSLKAVKLSGDRNSPVLDTFVTLNYVDYGMGPGASRDDVVSRALGDLRRSQGIKSGDEVYVSIAGQDALGRVIDVPPVSADRIRETIQNEARSQLPIKLEDAVWDFNILEDDLMGGEDDLKVSLFAAKREVVDTLMDQCEAAGLEVTGVQVAPIGIYNYIKFEFDDDVSDACVAIDIGADNTDVVVIEGQRTFLRVVPVAGNEVTKALRARFKLSMEDAEKLKRRAGKSKDAAAVFEAMKPPLKEMVGEIYRAVGYYKNQNPSANIHQLVMMGNGSKLLNIKKFFEQQLQYVVHKIGAPHRISASGGVNASELNKNIASLTVAIGLALQGLGVEGTNTLNLIPPERLRAREEAKLRVPFYVGGALALLGGVIALVLAFVGTADVGSKLDLARQADAAAKTASAEYNKSIDINSKGEGDKARSFRNLTHGRLGVLEYKVKDPDTDESVKRRRTLELKREAIPGLLMRSVDEAVAEFAAENEKKEVLRVNVNDENNGMLKDGVFASFTASSDSVWKRDPDADEGGFFAQTTTYDYIAYLGLDGLSPERAKKAMVGKDGTLSTRVNDAILGYLKQSGQLDGVPEKTVEKLDLSKMVTVEVLFLVDTKNVDLDKVKDGEFYVKGDTRPVRGANRAEIGIKLTIVKIRVSLVLNEVAPLPTAEEEEDQ